MCDFRVKISKSDLDELIQTYRNEALSHKNEHTRRCKIKYLKTFEDYFALQDKPWSFIQQYPHAEACFSNFMVKLKRAEMLIEYFLDHKKKDVLIWK